jgi:ABC-type sugar transport system permease subunit
MSKENKVEYVAGQNEKRERLTGFMMALPAIVLLIAFTVYP